MTALTIVQDACGRIGIQQPTALFSSTDQEAIQLRSLLNNSGKKVARSHDWQALKTEATFTTVAQSLQTGAVPSDFDRYLNETMFNRTRSEKVFGPMTAEEWQLDKSGFNTFTIDSAFRFRGRQLLITPNPTAGDSVYYEYITKNWAESSTGTAKSAFTADDDVTLLDEELLTLDLIWRFFKAKGLDYAEHFNDFQIELANAKGRDGSNRVLSMANEFEDNVRVNIPEGNWTL